MSSGRWTLPPAWVTRDGTRLPRAARSTSSDHLSEVQFRHHECLHALRELANRFSGNGQAVIRRNLPTFDAALPRAISDGASARRAT